VPTTDLLDLAQPGIFRQGLRSHWFGHFAVGDRRDRAAIAGALRALREASASQGVELVVGFGDELWRELAPAGDRPAVLRPLRPIRGVREMVATQEDLFVWLQGDEADHVVAVLLAAHEALGAAGSLRRETTSFVYLDSRDLTGFVDGTANPGAEEAPGVALVPEGEPGVGGSHVLAQKWRHDLASFNRLPVVEQERVIGRTKPDSVELDDAPPDAHIRKVEIEDGTGHELAIYRRSVPWGTFAEQGLYFLAFSADPGRFVTMLESMFGAGPDGVADRLTGFSTPVSGAIYWAPARAVLDALVG